MNYEITTDCELCIFVIYNVVYQGAFCPLVLCVPLRLFARLGLFDLYVLLASCVSRSDWIGISMVRYVSSDLPHRVLLPCRNLH